jgi:putative DNA primase/helicase
MPWRGGHRILACREIVLAHLGRRTRRGAKADCCLILEGPQGIRKSTALRTVAGEYFADELADLGSLGLRDDRAPLDVVRV